MRAELKPAQEGFWGGYSGYFSDPDGFLWEAAWNPSFPIAEDAHARRIGSSKVHNLVSRVLDYERPD